MSTKRNAVATFFIATALFVSRVGAYEINNHADMSQTSAERSTLSVNGNEKLFKIGLKRLDIADPKQTFPLDPSLPQIPYCFKSYLPGGTIREYDAATSGRIQEPGTSQPGWVANPTLANPSKLTIAELFRYGACYEDSEEPNVRPYAHFYNPQDLGRALTVGVFQPGPSSIDWMLRRNPLVIGNTGPNHYTYMDARDAFYNALTFNASDSNALTNEEQRRRNWGLTFQALGHVMHHLQDMGSPQHVRNDAHCNKSTCQGFGIYRPSGFEFYFDTQFQLVRNLAQTASAPIVFGLPREFWNTNTNNDLVTTNPTGVMQPDEGIAAYTSTNFTSAGKDYQWRGPRGNNRPVAADGLAFPKPSPGWNDANITDLYANESANTVASIVTTLCDGNANNCKMRFWGTETNPSARTSSMSRFSQVLLRPTGAYEGSGSFQQNFFTYNDAATKLIPKAVEYSAGLINYFFRGEMEISLPDEGVYGIVDHAVEKSKGTDGFRFLKLKVKNVTPAIVSARGTTPQNMTAGSFVAVAKFRRNNCYLPNLGGQIGKIDGPSSSSENTYAACASTVDEIVVSNPETLDLNAGEPAKTISFDFPNPIPIEATDLYLQVVFKGKLGEEEGAVAVTTLDVSEPTFITYANTNDFSVNGAGTLVANVQSTAGTRYSDLGGWLGFSREDARIRIAQFPVPGIAPGTFSRLALIADIQRPASSNPAANVVNQTVAFAGISGGDVPSFGATDVPHWLYYGVSFIQNDCNLLLPNGDQSPCSMLSRVSASQTQMADDGTVTVPSYWTMRGMVIKRDQNPSANPKVLSALVERRFSFQNYPLAAEGATPQSILAQYPPMAQPAPIAFGAINFSRADVARNWISQSQWQAEQLNAPFCRPADVGYYLLCQYIHWYPVGRYIE